MYRIAVIAGGCGGNLEWHTEADTIEIADRVALLRDMRLYAGTVFRAANLAVHPLDFRSTLAQVASILDGYEARLGRLFDWHPLKRDLASTQSVVDRFYKACQMSRRSRTRSYNDAILMIGRALVSALYSREGRYRQDVADHIPLLPEFGAAADGAGAVPDGILRTELLRASNRLRRVLAEVSEAARVIRQR